MGRWVIVDRPTWSDRARSDDDTYVFAPSLRALPVGFPLVMATLPVSDWNGELMRGLDEIGPIVGARCYAAVMMIDPFMLWEDAVDLLLEKRFFGVVNFPPAALVETSPLPTSEGYVNTMELERMRWFADSGLKLALTSVTPEAIGKVGTLFQEQPEAVLYAPATSLSCPVASVTTLVRSDEMDSEVPVWSLPTLSSP